MDKQNDLNRTHTIVIGGGQAGLAVGYHLAKRGIPFMILDASQRVGDAWRNRWDSLRLFTPSRYTGLPGFPFPDRGEAFPTKDHVADYLESYAAHFHLPVRNGVKVDRLFKENGRFIVMSGQQRMEADNVVVAMANYQAPKVPSFAHELHPGIVQLHSHEYRNPWQLQDGRVLIVGVGNSGADIGIEVARTHTTCISGKESGHIPWPIETFRWGGTCCVPGDSIHWTPHTHPKHSHGAEGTPQATREAGPVDSDEAPGPGRRRSATRRESRGRAQRMAAARRWTHARSRERDLVHGLPSRLLVD
jgi:hypothetical protein